MSYILTGRRVEGPPGEPVALETRFGWCFLGKVLTQNSSSEPVVLHARVEPDLGSLVQRFWKLDHFPTVTGPHGDKDQLVERRFVDTCSRDSEGRFSVALLFKEGQPTFRGSRQLAERRFLALERRFSRNPELHEEYNAFMEDYINCKHMSLVTSDLNNGYYIPHHAILKPGSQTTKLRVVFDASAKDLEGRSLNEQLEPGPPLQRPILAILLRFRCQAVGFMADVKGMYRQIWIRSEDRIYQRILWRSQPDQPLQTFQLNTVTYGLSSSPYLALRCLQELVTQEGEKWPRAAEVVLSDTYIDDVISGGAGVEEARSLQAELIQLFRSGGFELRKWACSDPTLLTHLDPSVDHQIAMPAGGEGPDSCLKVLGMWWDPRTDHFSYSVQVEPRKCTKRTMLSDLARIYDPLGLLCPITFLMKYWIQLLWVLQLGWDEPVPNDLEVKWRAWQQQLPLVSKLSVPRFVLVHSAADIQLHAFCDASERGYGVGVYVRCVGSDQRVQVHLLAAKNRVAPLKRRTIPRLELCSAVLLADLVTEVRTEGATWLGKAPLVAWTDSMIVLAWLRSRSAGYKQFVGNRIGHIQETVGAPCFRHVPTTDNPADLASRGILPGELQDQELWWSGPRWIREDERCWPKQPSSVPLELEDSERRAVCLQVAVSDLEWWDRWSSLKLLVAVRAWINRFVHNCRAQQGALPRIEGILTETERQRALRQLVGKMQEEVFRDTLRRVKAGKRLERSLQKLNLFLDEEGILRVGGRLCHSALGASTKFPMLLPRQHPLTSLIIWDVHLRYCHPGTHTMLFLLRQNFWLLSPRRAIQARLRECVPCFRANPIPRIPKMGDLPPSRVLEAKAFLHVAIDMAGPFLIRPVAGRGRNRQAQKMYVCVFVCQATKAIHIELVFDLTAEAFIAALRRFVARRGHCARINCDNGTNFVGGARILLGLLRQASEANEISFEFNPAGGPHFGGLHEAGVKSIKTHLFRVIGAQSLTIEEFLTLLAQIEALLNSRPLWVVSSDARDPEVLTPGHFLLLEPLTVMPDPDMTGPLNTLSRWQLIQRLQQEFWKRWHQEYLTTLNQRQKWTVDSAPLLEGSLVVIKGDCKPMFWELARVDKLHFGKDGRARVATLRSKRGTFQRPVVKLCPLPGVQRSDTS